MSVKVGVRVRPFNKRQQQLGAKLVVQMEDTVTHLIDQEGQKKSFNYDYSFWSHDGFEVDEEGYNRPIGDKYADQRKVYTEIGSSILVNAWQGYNCCLFAYGQTGSGKSYSMIGYGANKGVIPIVCNQIFQKIKNNHDDSRSFQVKVSMLEIYNQAVKDLLSKSKKQELKICEHKTLGVYVEGLTKHSVDSYDTIQKKIDEGSNNRSIAATLMNQSSSRSHTIVSINFVQKIQISVDQTSVKYSCIHLVDLAGSECVAKTGVNSKDRLRETAKINQSLSTLGRVIEILADNCSKKEKDKAFVPYRDSKLTFILRNALGGNSRTAMICAISPADDNFEETLSTLRYASRAKKIQNRAIVNESDVDKLIRQLRQENQTLKKMLEEARQAKGGLNYEMISGFNEMNKNMMEMGLVNDKEEESLLNDLQQESNQADNSYFNESVSIVQGPNGVNENQPYLTNISEDQLLSFRIKYSCDKLMIGNKQGNPKPDIVLASLGIQPNHAFISFDSDTNKCYLEVLDENSSNYTFVNGGQINMGVKEELYHLDRVIFGTGCVFLYMFKNTTPRADKPELKQIDYQFAIGEMQSVNPEKNSMSGVYSEKSIVEEEELRKKLITQIQQEFETNKKNNEEEMKKQIQQKEREYHEKLREMELSKEAEAARLKQELEEREQQSRKLEEERMKIKGEVSRYLEQNKVSKLRQQKGKQQLQQTKKNLEKKMRQINELEHRMLQLQAKTEQKKQQLKFELKRQEQDMKRELQIQTIICHNENIINEYKLQQNKRMKHAAGVREYMVKKERIQIMKQLTELVPQVQKFNLIAKEMSKKIECGLSIEYRYITDAEIVESSKNNTYKSKLKITVHVIHHEEGRSYYWSLDIFRNRFEHALEMWDEFIRRGKNFKWSKQADPYWDPQTYQAVAYGHLTLECLMFNIAYAGDVAIVKGGKKIGRMEVNIYPADSLGLENLTIQGKGENGTYKITSPHEQIQKTLFFVLEISFIEVVDSNLDFDSFKIEYELLEGIKMVRYSSEILQRIRMDGFKYKKVHMLKDISETTIMHYMEKPVIMELQIIQKVTMMDELTHRSSFTMSSNLKGSFARQIDVIDPKDLKDLEFVEVPEFSNISPPSSKKQQNNASFSRFKSADKPNNISPNRKVASGVIYENTQITKKVEQDYLKKKLQEVNNAPLSMKKKRPGTASFGGDKKDKEKDCVIY